MDCKKLTPIQNKVIWHLQNGWSLVTDSSVKGAWVSKSKSDVEYHINNGIFWRLVDKGLIYQEFEKDRFCYVLTDLGINIPTKKP